MRTVSNNKQLFNTHTKPPCTKIILTITTKKKKNHFNYYLTIWYIFGNYLINPMLFKTTYFQVKLFSWNVRENCKFIQSVKAVKFNFQSQTGTNCDAGGRDKIFMCLPSKTPQGWLRFIRTAVPKIELPSICMRKNQKSTDCSFLGEVSLFLIVIRLIIHYYYFWFSIINTDNLVFSIYFL